MDGHNAPICLKSESSEHVVPAISVNAFSDWAESSEHYSMISKLNELSLKDQGLQSIR